MPSNQGRDEQSSSGKDNGEDALWLDLVARLQEPEDTFLDSESKQTPPTSVPPESTKPDSAKTVGDFDPLGVWQRQIKEPPNELASDERTEMASQPGEFQFSEFQPRELGPRDYATDPDEDGFVPPTPPAFSASDPNLLAAWIGAAGGPLLLIVAAVFWRQIPILLVIALVLGFIAGTAYLLFRLPSDRDHHDGDGAVV